MILDMQGSVDTARKPPLSRVARVPPSGWRASHKALNELGGLSCDHYGMRTLSATLALLITCAAATAQTASSPPPAAASSITTLQAITVTGVMPGPGLWKVTRGDHVLWILGVVPTLPAGIEWRSSEVAQTIAGSQA